MSYAIIGFGKIGHALAKAFVRTGIEVSVATTRDPESFASDAAAIGPEIIPKTLAEAVKADIIFLAVRFESHPDVAKALPTWHGKIIVDVTNAYGVPPEELGGQPSSKFVAHAFTGGRLVKGFNHLAAAILDQGPDVNGGRRVVFLASDDDSAAAEVGALAENLGFAPIKLGGLSECGLLVQARGPMARSNPSSTTSSIGVPRKNAPRTERRSSTPISVVRAITIRRSDLAQNPTLDQLHALGLYGMAKAFVEISAADQADSLGHHEWLGLLLDREASWRRDKRFSARLRIAKLRPSAAIEDVDYRSPRGLDRALFQKLAQGEWIDAHDNLILAGPTGVGKSWLACAIGHKACRDNRSVLYHRVPKLFEDLALVRGDGRHPRLLRSLGRADLLILDDWGLEPLDAAARHDLLEILEERYGRRSTIVTSQPPLDRWHEIIADPTYADAILDRLVHNAHRIELSGESMRRTRGKQNQKA